MIKGCFENRSFSTFRKNSEKILYGRNLSSWYAWYKVDIAIGGQWESSGFYIYIYMHYQEISIVLKVLLDYKSGIPPKTLLNTASDTGFHSYSSMVFPGWFSISVVWARCYLINKLALFTAYVICWKCLCSQKRVKTIHRCFPSNPLFIYLLTFKQLIIIKIFFRTSIREIFAAVLYQLPFKDF